MPELLKVMLSSDGFLPQGHGDLWRPGVVWLHVTSDAVVALACTSIAVTLAYVWRRRRDLPLPWMTLCSGLFIVACGASHATEIWTLWTPTWWLSGIIKAITAAASLSTAVVLVKLVPTALAIPTPRQLASAQLELQVAHDALERRVRERTAELSRCNDALAAELAERNRVERTADAKLVALLEAAPDAMVIVDPHGRIAIVNAEAERLFGYSRAQLLGQPVDLLVPPRLRTSHASHHRAYFHNPTGRRAMGAGQQLVGLRSDGSEFPAEIRLSPIATADGLLVSSAIRDATERNRAEHALRVARDAAEAAYAELEAFSYSVAHDLRAPLRAMSGHSAIVLEDHGDALAPDARHRLERIIAAALRMGDIIDALLSLARLTRTEPRREPVDLTQMAHAVVEQLRASEPQRAVDFVASDGLVVDADPKLLRLLLDNLLGNAWKFTGRQPRARVELGREEVDGTLAYYVRDNGAGFDMTLADKLFAPFRRLHAPAEFAGTGIGLATVQRIVRRHGGRVWAEGAEAQGATFRFTLSSLPPARAAAWAPAP